MLRQLILLLIAVMLAGYALLLPPTWGPFASRLSFTGQLPAGNAVLGPDLPIPLVSQYQGLATDNVNCGPATVAAALRYARPDLSSMDDAALVAAVRQATGIPVGDTYLPSLVRAFSSFGVPSAPLFANDAEGGNPLAAIRLALAHGRPVIATVGGTPLGRGASYGDHFVLIIGMDAQTEQVDVLDPDTQAAPYASWVAGGRQSWSSSLTRAALAAAQEHDALGVVAGAQRASAVAPATVFLPVAAIMLLLALYPWRGRVLPLPKVRSPILHRLAQALIAPFRVDRGS
jgi:hypothetical protein